MFLIFEEEKEEMLNIEDQKTCKRRSFNSLTIASLTCASIFHLISIMLKDFSKEIKLYNRIQQPNTQKIRIPSEIFLKSSILNKENVINNDLQTTAKTTTIQQHSDAAFDDEKQNVTRNNQRSNSMENTVDLNTREKISAYYNAMNKPRYRDKTIHFLSHIPKSGATYVKEELNRLLRITTRLPKNQSLKDIKRSQERYHYDQYEGNFFADDWLLDRESFPIDLIGKTDAYTPPMICNFATSPFEYLEPYYLGIHDGVEKRIRYKCAMSMTEQPWNMHAQNVYTIVREPFSHVLSQYFHCSESESHSIPKEVNGEMIDRRELMASSLDEWLEPYAKLKESNLDQKGYNRRADELYERFRCYNPIDTESVFTQFNTRILLENKNYTYPYPNTEDYGERDKSTKEIDKILFDDLKHKYKIIGDTSQMVRTVCAIFIEFLQGKFIPKICDCTNSQDDENDEGTNNDDSSNNNSRFCMTSLWDFPKNNNQSVCSYRMGGYHPTIDNSHGVKHHGSTHLKVTTQHQRELIGRIRSNDLILYNISRAVFDKQIQEIETKHGIKVCNRWNRPI